MSVSSNRPHTPAPQRRVAVGTTFTLTAVAPTMTFLRVRPAEVPAEQEYLVVDGPGGRVVLGPALVDTTASGPGFGQFQDRVLIPAGECTVRYSAIVVATHQAVPRTWAAAPSIHDLTPQEWWWLQPTRYCRPDDLGDEAWATFGAGVTPEQPATATTVQAICDHVGQSMTFEYGSTTTQSSAHDAWIQRRGVCRDFNHIAISFCRALNIPSRYVFGYLPDIDVPPVHAPMDFCAWFEVFLDGRWWTFDARVNEPRIGRFVVGRGRDAADVPMISTLGATTLTEFSVDAREYAPVLADALSI
jgi:transglutaminase-like putative cysteine protease